MLIFIIELNPRNFLKNLIRIIVRFLLFNFEIICFSNNLKFSKQILKDKLLGFLKTICFVLKNFIFKDCFELIYSPTA